MIQSTCWIAQVTAIGQNCTTKTLILSKDEKMTLIGQNHNITMTNSLKSANKTQEEDLISARPLKALHRG